MEHSNNSLRGLLFSKDSDSNLKESSSSAPSNAATASPFISTAASPFSKSSQPQPLKVTHISPNTLHSLRQSLSTSSTKTQQMPNNNPQPIPKQKRFSGKTSVRSMPGNNSHFQLLSSTVLASSQSSLNPNQSYLSQPLNQGSISQPLNIGSPLAQSPLRFQLSQAPLCVPRSSPKRQHMPSANFRAGQPDRRQQKQTLLAKVSKTSSPWGYEFPSTNLIQAGGQGDSFSKFMGGQPASPQLDRFSTSPDPPPTPTPMFTGYSSSLSAVNNAGYSVAPSENYDEGFSSSSISKPLVMNPNSLFDANDSNDDSGSDETSSILGDTITMPQSSNEASFKFVKSQLNNQTFKERLLKRHGQDSKKSQGLPQMGYGRKTTGKFSLGSGNNTALRSFGLKSAEAVKSSDPLIVPVPAKFGNKTKSQKTQYGHQNSSKEKKNFSSQSEKQQDSSSSENNDTNNDTGYDTGYTSSYTSSMDSKQSNKSIPPNPAGLYSWTDRLMRERETAPPAAFPDQDNLLNVGFLPISPPSMSAMCSQPVLPAASKKHRTYSVLRPMPRGFMATNVSAPPAATGGFVPGSLAAKPASIPNLEGHKIIHCVSEIHKSGSQLRPGDTSEGVKEFRYKRTEEALHKSGMWDVAMKTGNLIRKNQELQQELNTFKGDALIFLKSVMKNPQNKDFIRTLLINVLKSAPGGRKQAMMATIMGLAKKQGIVQPAAAETDAGVPGTGNSFPGTGNVLGSGTGNGVPGNGNDVSGNGNGVPVTGNIVSGIGNGVPETGLFDATNTPVLGMSVRCAPGDILDCNEGGGLDLRSASKKTSQPGPPHVLSNFHSQGTLSVSESYPTVTAGLSGVDMRCTAVVKEEPADLVPLSPWLPASPRYASKPELPLAASSTPT